MSGFDRSARHGSRREPGANRCTPNLGIPLEETARPLFPGCFTLPVSLPASLSLACLPERLPQPVYRPAVDTGADTAALDTVPGVNFAGRSW